MSALWGSARQALGYMFSARRGPTLRQPRYTDASASTGHHHLDHVLVGALLYGDPSKGETGLGVEPGSDLDEEIREWALDRGVEASDRVIDVVCALRILLEQRGLLARTACPAPSQFYRYVNPDGSRSGVRMRAPRAPEAE